MKEKRKMRIEQGKAGSALIMTVVLTVLLSIIAVMFVAVARMDMAATSNIADNKMLDSAVKSIIEIINKELVFDTPGVAGQEYYDYPDTQNTWLANLEPYLYDNNGTPADANDDIYRWRQISNINNYLSGSTQDVSVGSSVIKDYPVLNLGGLADADGDGIADSKWFELEDLHTSKGKPIYAAVRVIDNGGMVNINTAYSFDADDANINEIDGSSQMQINLNGLLRGADTIGNLHTARCGGASQLWTDYQNNVIWQYGIPTGGYLPFDISDELELRYRYCIDSKFRSRVETDISDTIQLSFMKDQGSLYDNSSLNWQIGDWQIRITDPNDPKADRRHLLTTLSLDRIIAPDGNKMANINNANVNNLYSSIRRGLLDADNSFPDVDKVSAQVAVNIIDYRDNDSNVTAIDVNGVTYYGFEQPCVYISELAYKADDPNDVNSYAIELYKPYSEDGDPCRWKLFIDNKPYEVNWSGTKQFHIIEWEDSKCPLTIDSNASVQTESTPGSNAIFDVGNTISLIREVNDVNVVVDSVVVPGWLINNNNIEHSFQRDITLAKCIRRLWDSNDRVPTLGSGNVYNTNGDANFIQAHPADSNFTSIGQIGMIFRKGAYYKLNGNSNGIIGYNNSLKEEYQVRLNLADQNFQQIFKYLTVIDPFNFDAAYANETRIKGRININTAPAYVLAQLPWVSLRENDYNDANLAKAIVAYRDKSEVRNGDANYPDYRGPDPCGFRSIGELCNVVRDSVLRIDPNFGINYYSRDYEVDGITPIDQAGFPDLTTPDGAANDFEERDLIFARISDLVTVRSDMFTAYILVRIGTDGPQKRVITILDRSAVTAANNRVAIRAFQLTPEAR
jgi:hypothetical protein